MGIQSAYLGTTNRGDLIKTAGHMSNKRGPEHRPSLMRRASKTDLVVNRSRLLGVLKAGLSEKPKPFGRKNTESTPDSLVKSAVSGEALGELH